jgi:hypothetical protein
VDGLIARDYNNVIWAAVDPTDLNDPNHDPDDFSRDVIVVGGETALRSLNGGRRFDRIIADGGAFALATSAHVDNHAIVPHPNFPANRSVYFGNDGGVQRADDILAVELNSGWTNLAHDLGLTQFWAGKATQNGAWVFGCGQDIDAVWRSAAAGINDWGPCLNETSPCDQHTVWQTGDSRGCVIEQDSPSPGEATFFHLRGNKVCKITSTSDPYSCCIGPVGPCGDLGVGIFNPCSSDHTGTDEIGRAIVRDPNHADVLVVGGRASWRSFDRARNWDQIRPADCSRIEKATAVDIANENSNLIWAGYDNGRLVHTDGTVCNEGSLCNWVEVNVPGTLACADETITVDCAVSDILIDPQDSQRVFVTFAGKGYTFRLNCPQNVFVTTNGGVCWTPLMGTDPFALPATAAWTITMHADNPNWLYVGTNQGVYASEDGGLTWGKTPLYSELHAKHEGPYNVMVRELSWHDPDYLVAATYGLGMHRIRAPVTVFVDKAFVGSELGTLAQPFNTVSEALDLAGNGSSISIKGATYDEPGQTTFNRRGFVSATEGTVTIR